MTPLPKPWQTGGLFLLAIGCASYPAYIEGNREMRNEPAKEGDDGTFRRVGIYCLMVGYGVLFLKRRASIPFLPPALRRKLF